MTNIEKQIKIIKEFAENNTIIRSKDVEEIGSRGTKSKAFSKLVKEGFLERVEPGVFKVVGRDEYQQPDSPDQEESSEGAQGTSSDVLEIFLNGQFLVAVSSDTDIEENFPNMDIRREGNKIFLTSRTGQKG